MEKEQEKYPEIHPHENCLCCGARIDYGHSRSDRKFCSDRCKNAYHNKRRYHYCDMKEKVDGILEENHQLLENVLRLGITQISLNVAVSMGFRPGYSTSVYRCKGYLEYGCYDISYRISDNRIFNIHRLALTLREINQL